jgi:hypothetical protein
VSPNPVIDGVLKISYLLPQNKPGLFMLYDAMGREVYKMPLPAWSTLQQIRLPNLANGVYSTVIISTNQRVVKKLVILAD